MDKLINALMMYKRKSLKSYACSMTLESMVFFFYLAYIILEFCSTSCDKIDSSLSLADARLTKSFQKTILANANTVESQYVDLKITAFNQPEAIILRLPEKTKQQNWTWTW